MMRVFKEKPKKEVKLTSFNKDSGSKKITFSWGGKESILEQARKTEVEAFWNNNPCEGEWKYLHSKIRFRYTREPYIPFIINNYIKKSDVVLEIGCGQGIDTLKIAKITDHLTAIDITGNAIERTKQMLSKFNKKGILMRGDAENLEFKDNSFDVVYSYGVLHHTPNTKKAISEVYRVLKNEAHGVIMLYHSWSLLYPIIFLVRLLTFPFRKSIEKYIIKTKNTKLGTSVLEVLCSPILKAYSSRQIRDMFKQFKLVKIEYYQTGFYRLNVFVTNRQILKLIDILERFTRPLGIIAIIYVKK